MEVLAEYPDGLSFEKWTLLRLEAHIATKMAALLKLDCVDLALAAEVLARASTVDIQELPTMTGEVFNLTAKIVRLSKTDQKRAPAALKPTANWLGKLH